MHRPLAVVVVTHDAATDLARCLTSVTTALGTRAQHVVVVDNGSSDDTVAVARGHDGVTVVAQDNTGFAHGVNRGVDRAPDGADILVLNADLVLDPAAIDRLQATLERHADAAVVVPSLWDPDGAVAPSLKRDPTVLGTLLEAVVGGSRAGRFGEAYRPGPRTHEVDWATGAAMLLRREVLTDVGHLDETFFLYSEETEYCQRVRRQGYRVLVEPTAKVVHRGGDLRVHPALWALRAVNRVRLFRRHHGAVHGAAFWAAQLVFEARRAITARATTWAAVRALLHRDLEAQACRLVDGLGGDRSVVRPQPGG